jgi:hypothetical protein
MDDRKLPRSKEVLTYRPRLLVGQWTLGNGLNKDNARWKNIPVRSLNSPTG